MKLYNFFKQIIFLTILILVSSCGTMEKLKTIHRPVDLRKEPLDPDEKARKNINEGRGISLGGLGRSNTTYEFSTSNPMWRATLSSLDFLPLSTVDYSGGLIVSDWYNNENSSNESLKITVRFLSNEIQANSLDIKIHQKICFSNNCTIKLIKSAITEELAKSILTKAAILEKEKKTKK